MAGEQLGVTEEMAGEVAWAGAEPEDPPQAITHERTRQAISEQSKRVFKGVPRLAPDIG